MRYESRPACSHLVYAEILWNAGMTSSAKSSIDRLAASVLRSTRMQVECKLGNAAELLVDLPDPPNAGVRGAGQWRALPNCL